MDVYISGRINGNPQHEQEFRKAAVDIMAMGHRAVVPQDIPPHEHDGPCPPSYSYSAAPGGHSAACYLRTDISFMLTCDAIYLLRGWELSIGARLEQNVAAMCGLKIMHQEVAELQKRVQVANVINMSPPDYGLRGDAGLGGSSEFKGDASRLFERRYEESD